MVGKTDEAGANLVPWTGELSPRLIALLVARRLHAFHPGLDLPPAPPPSCRGTTA